MTKISQWVTTMASRTPGSSVSLVGQGSFLDKPTPHMVGYMGKSPPNINAPHDGWCPVCESKGQTQALKTYRINFTQSIFLCTNPQCIYPLGYTPLDNIITNTADLKKDNSPNKKKRRQIFDKSPHSLPCEKRLKIDLPVLCDSPTVQADPGFPAVECETSFPSKLQHGLEGDTGTRVQNAPGTTDLLNISRIPSLFMGSLGTNAPAQPNGLSVAHNGPQEVLQNGDLKVIDPLHPSPQPNSTEVALMAKEVDEMKGISTEPTESSTTEHILNDLAFNSDPVSTCVSTLTLQNSHQEYQVTENSLKELSLPQGSINISSDLESRLSLSCDVIKNLGLSEPSGGKAELSDNSNMDTSSCNKKSPPLIQDQHLEVHENEVASELQHEKSDQQIESTLLLNITPPVCPEAPVQNSSFGSADGSDQLLVNQESCERTNPIEDVLREGPSEDWVPQICEGTVSSLPCLVAEDVRQTSEESLSKSNSDLPLTNSEPERSVVTSEETISCLPLIQEQVQDSCKTNAEELIPVTILQNAHLESQKDDSALKDSINLPLEEDHTYAAPITSKGNQLSKIYDDSLSDHKNDSLLDIQPVCPENNKSFEKVCEPQDSSACVKDAMNKMPLPGPQVLLQDCLKCHCGMNVQQKTCSNPSTSVKDQAQADIPLPHVTIDDGSTHKSPIKMSLPAPKVLLQDCMKCHCHIPSQSLLKNLDKSSASEVLSDERAVAEKVLTDSPMASNTTVENTKPTPQEQFESLLSQQKKRFYESTILPDLLMDIQPEHRMEEPSPGAPNPECDTSLPSDMDVPKQDSWQNGRVSECDNETETELQEVLSDSFQDGSKMSDNLETSINSEGLADSDEELETKREGAAQATRATRRLSMSERRLQWKNKHSLCWLDCILSALVQSETLKHFVAKGRHISKESLIDKLFTEYRDATTMYLNSLQKKQKRPKHEKVLNDIRMEIFEKLAPLLKCHLGKKDSPVFALPLLLKEDPETEKLFMHSFVWQFKCEACGFSYQQGCCRSLTTFTHILPEWHPLNAVHIGPCNRCRNTQQRRTMVLEKLNSLFMVHFVEGLPSNNLDKYSFQFQGHLYEVKEVIKYKNKHFSTWIANNDDGSWLESDDLRGAFCRRYQKFMVRAPDMHIVIWERSDVKTLEENVELSVAEPFAEFYSASVTMPTEDLSIPSVSAPEPPQQVAPMLQQVAPSLPPVALNMSDPLAGMEGYAADDVITLTLVEIPFDANGKPVETPTAPQPTDANTAPVKANQVEDSHNGQYVMSTNAKLASQEDSTLISYNSSDSNIKSVPIKNCKVVLSPMKESPLKPPGEAVATSTPIQKPHNTKKSAGGNWMTRLLSKDHAIASSHPLSTGNKLLNLKTCPPLKVTDPSCASKKAQNFNSFQGRSSSKTSLLASNLFQQDTASKPTFCVPKEMPAPVSKPLPMVGLRKSGNSGIDYRKLVKEGSSSSEDKILKLRRKLLKKLKAKKNELATLEMLSKKQQGGTLNGQAYGGFNRKEHLQGFLQELQDQIDNADNESVCTMSSNASMCSSPGDADFFAELFSPSPGNSQPADGRYLEMLADGMASRNQLPQTDAHQGGMGVLESTLESSSLPTTSTLNNSARDESLNLMSHSTLAVLNEDNDYFDFDDYF